MPIAHAPEMGARGGGCSPQTSGSIVRPPMIEKAVRTPFLAERLDGRTDVRLVLSEDLRRPSCPRYLNIVPGSTLTPVSPSRIINNVL